MFFFLILMTFLFQIVLAVKLGIPVKEAITSVHTLSDFEGLCVSFAASEGSSDPVVAVEVNVVCVWLS